MNPIKQIAVPKMFFDDHYWRELPTPKIIGHKHGHYVVAAGDPAIPELLSDAEHYATGVDDCDHRLVSSAKRTAQALRLAMTKVA